MPSQDDIRSEFSQFIEETLVRQNQNLSGREEAPATPSLPYQGGMQQTQASPLASVPTDTVNAVSFPGARPSPDCIMPCPPDAVNNYVLTSIAGVLTWELIQDCT